MLDIARSIWRREIARIPNYQKLFMEGVDQYPVDALAKRQGSEVVYLDRDNPYFDKLPDSSFVRPETRVAWQQSREGIWVERIDTPGLLVVGARHVCNEFGLVEKLQGRSIMINTVLSFEQESLQSREGTKRLLAIEERVWEAYCTN